MSKSNLGPPSTHASQSRARIQSGVALSLSPCAAQERTLSISCNVALLPSMDPGCEVNAQQPLSRAIRVPASPRTRQLRLGGSPAFPIGLALLLRFASLAFAQSYSIDSFTIAGGGATSTGGVYSVSGTIGQPDAGAPTTNGQYSVTGGFWALPAAVQAIGAPTLTIVPATPSSATISWSPVTQGFVLQETRVLSPANWTNSPSGPTNPVTVPAMLPVKFYRLSKT